MDNQENRVLFSKQVDGKIISVTDEHSADLIIEVNRSENVKIIQYEFRIIKNKTKSGEKVIDNNEINEVTLTNSSYPYEKKIPISQIEGKNEVVYKIENGFINSNIVINNKSRFINSNDNGFTLNNVKDNLVKLIESL